MAAIVSRSTCRSGSMWCPMVRWCRRTDFQGQHGCSSPHKIVEFDLLGSAAVHFAVEQRRSRQCPPHPDCNAGAKVVAALYAARVGAKISTARRNGLRGGASDAILEKCGLVRADELSRFASLRQAVRLACFAAASSDRPALQHRRRRVCGRGGRGGAAGSGSGAETGDAAAKAETQRLRHRAIAANAKRMTTSSDGRLIYEQVRIAVQSSRPNEAHMKLR